MSVLKVHTQGREKTMENEMRDIKLKSQNMNSCVPSARMCS